MSKEEAPEVLMDVPMALIKEPPLRMKRVGHKEYIGQLAASIEALGLIQPIIVRKIKDKYQIVAGYYRYLAHKELKRQVIKGIVRNITLEEGVMQLLSENVDRADIDPIQEATAIQMILAQTKITQAKLADGIGKSRSYITNRLRLLKQPESIQKYLRSGDLGAQHAIELASIRNEEDRKLLAEQTVMARWSVEMLRGQIKEYKRARGLVKDEEVTPEGVVVKATPEGIPTVECWILREDYPQTGMLYPVIHYPVWAKICELFGEMGFKPKTLEELGIQMEDRPIEEPKPKEEKADAGATKHTGRTKTNSRSTDAPK